MTAKIEIVRELGEQALLLPALLADALAANDRLKLRLTLLQEAVAHSRHAEEAPRSFAAERRGAGLADPQYDTTISGARSLPGGRILVPGAKTLIEGLAADLATMLAPLSAADAEASRPFNLRLGALAKALPVAENDELALRDIDAMTAARHGGADSVHLLVMDAHKAINRLAAETAVETIDGARVHHVDDADRARIKAFMAGLNRTAALAFGHPGLGTTAVHSGARLTIQNDIGTSDAHVIVIHVEDRLVNITYTDVHRVRAKFFISLFEGHGVEWTPLAEQSSHGVGEDDVFYLVTGRFSGADEPSLLRFLELLGSRIVFLIDWNKAAKLCRHSSARAPPSNF